MTYEILKKIERSEKDLEHSRLLAGYGVATVSEAQGKTGIMDDHIKPIQQGKSIAGRAITVECTGSDNLIIHAAFEVCSQGDVLVVSTPNKTKNGFFGELMANSAIKRGVVGLIIDGGVRDTEAMRKLGFPVWSRYVYVMGTTKNMPGNVNKEITCGNVTIYGGDFIVADDDGVVVVKKENLEATLENSRKRTEKEVQTREKIRNGELSIDFYNLRPKIAEANVKYS